jgi:hypothetical protein
MFFAIMPWPMTLALTNDEAIRHEKHAEKNLIIGEKIPS